MKSEMLWDDSSIQKTELDFEIEVTTQHYTSGIMGGEITVQTEYELIATARNSGQIYARYVNAFIMMPYAISYQDEFNPKEPVEEDGELYCEYYEDNTVRDVVDVRSGSPALIKKYGPSWFDPILPGLSHTWHIRLSNDFSRKGYDGLSIRWSIYADNAPPNVGEMLVEGIKMIDLRKS